ncbi:MAG: CidA/LrgA family protein [Clostridiaceae bacterium]|nr:CidA/LrgA family protein [Clostridiaceae bacterium]
MKQVLQFGVLCALYYVGDLVSRLTRLPIPGSVIGLLLLLILLRTRVLRERHVGDAADFLVKIMPVLFLPITAGLLASYGLISSHIAGFLTVTLVSTVAVFAATGLAAQGVIRHERRRAPVPATPPSVGEEVGEDES